MRSRLSLVLIGMFLVGINRLGYGKDYFIGPDALGLPADAVFGSDSYGSYADIPTSNDYDPLAWANPLFLEGGRYRATFLLRTKPFGTGGARIEFIVASYAAPVHTPFTCEVTGPDLPRDNSVYSLSMDVSVPTGDIDGIIQYRNNTAGELTTVRVYGLSLECLDEGLALTKVRPRKILYEPGESGFVDVTVQNFMDQEVSATLELTLIQELDRADPQPGTPITVRAGQTLEVALPFTGRTLQYGCEARVRLIQGEQILDEVSDFFGVSDNVFQVGLGGTTGLVITSSSGYADAETIASDVERCRTNYSNWWEKMFWAPDNWGDLTPEAEEWISGQSARWENANRIREFIAALKPHGIKAITYAQGSAKGPSGWELLRQHPEWFYAAPGGTPLSEGFDAWDLAHWNDTDLHMDSVGRLQFAADTWRLFPDLRQSTVLEWGINELIASMQDFGWDGVRFDGHWTAGNDALSTANMQRLKQAMLEENPDFLFGFNWGLSLGNQLWLPATGPMLSLEHEFRESMAGGGAYVQEGINYWSYGPRDEDKYKFWSEYATAEEAAARGVHALGGSYYFVYALDRLNPIDRLYKFAVGTICGVHPIYGAHYIAPGCPSWGRFLTRWSSIVWDTQMKPVSDGDVDVIADVPLLWRNWVKQRVVDETSRQVIVHLLNPQKNDQINVVDDLLPTPVSDVVVRVEIPEGQAVTKAILLDPWQSDQSTTLAITLDCETAQVTVPKVEVWSIVVFEFSGTFVLPSSSEQFTETPDPAEVEAGRQTSYPVMGGPLTSDESAGHRSWLYETDAGYNNVSAHGILDPEAGNGMAQVRDSNETWASIGRSWMGPFPPGCYVAKMRIKIEDTNMPSQTQTMRMNLSLSFSGESNYTDYGTSDWVLAHGLPSERTLIADGVYHDYDLSFELSECTYIHIIGKTETNDPADSRFLMDYILVKQEEAYTDAMLDPSPPEPPSVQIGGASGLDVLVVNGFTWNTYRLSDVWGTETRVRELWWRDWEIMDDFPQTIEGLAPYDVAVLADIDVGLLSLEARRALRDYVAAGGGLLLLGGPYAFGQGFLSGTYVEDVLPVSVSPRYGTCSRRPVRWY